MSTIGESLLMMRRPMIDLVVNATISKRSSGVAGSRTSRSNRQGDRCGSRQGTINNIGHRTATGRGTAIIARYWIGPADASMRERSPASAARCACRPTSVAVAACRCVSSHPRRTLLCCDVDGPRHQPSRVGRPRPGRSAQCGCRGRQQTPIAPDAGVERLNALGDAERDVAAT
jgi:hypothetical protein